jgi:cytochrome c oxidase subunit 4
MLTREEGKKVLIKGLIILGIVTLVEVGVALLGKGYVIEGFHLPKVVMYLVMIAGSIYKAWFIVFEFMHMKYEAKGLSMSVVLPTALLIWALIAFLMEGNYWNDSRNAITEKNSIGLDAKVQKSDVKEMKSEH